MDKKRVIITPLQCCAPNNMSIFDVIAGLQRTLIVDFKDKEFATICDNQNDYDIFVIRRASMRNMIIETIIIDNIFAEEDGSIREWHNSPITNIETTYNDYFSALFQIETAIPSARPLNYSNIFSEFSKYIGIANINDFIFSTTLDYSLILNKSTNIKMNEYLTKMGYDMTAYANLVEPAEFILHR